MRIDVFDQKALLDDSIYAFPSTGRCEGDYTKMEVRLRCYFSAASEDREREPAIRCRRGSQ